MKKNDIILILISASILFVIFQTQMQKGKEYKTEKERQCLEFFASNQFENSYLCYKTIYNISSDGKIFTDAIQDIANNNNKEAKEKLNNIIYTSKDNTLVENSNQILTMLIKKEKKESCDKYISEHNYSKAVFCYERLVDEIPDSSVKYNLAVALCNDRQYNKALRILALIIESDESDENVRSNSKILLNRINKEVFGIQNNSENIRKDYFDLIKEIYVWKNPNNISVYIGKYDSKSAIYEQAFNKWQEKTADDFCFRYTNKEKEADITIKSTSKSDVAKKSSLANAIGYTGLYGNENNNDEKKYLKKADIFIALDDGKNRLSDKIIYATALHEIGHALGITNHSLYEGDIMYPQTNHDNPDDIDISNRDINTIKKLYEF